MHMNFVGDPIVLPGPVDMYTSMSILFPKIECDYIYNLKNHTLKKTAMNSIRERLEFENIYIRELMQI